MIMRFVEDVFLLDDLRLVDFAARFAAIVYSAKNNRFAELNAPKNSVIQLI